MISAKHLLPLVLVTGTLLHAVPNLEVNSAPDRWSAPFEVLDQPKGVYGEYRRTAEIYHKGAAQAASVLIKTCWKSSSAVRFRRE